MDLNGHSVLRDINLKISSGEIVTIVGPNGAGKSTLVRCIIGAVRPSGGILQVRPSLRIGYAPQRLQIDPTLPLTVRGFLNLPLKVLPHVSQQALDNAGAGNLSNQQMASLSGGQLQRVLLARALLNRPELLLLDETSQGLDHLGSVLFYRLIEELRTSFGCAVLMISHELHVVMAASDRVICLNGHVCCQGAPEHVLSAPEYRTLFGHGTQGALALYRHKHNHQHN